MMETKENDLIKEERKRSYVTPAIIEKAEITVDLQTNILTDEPPPPL